VLPAIDLDNKFPFPAHEIADVSSQCFLPNELATTDLPVTKTLPEFSFRVGLVDPESAGQTGHLAS
jgi:hypothetical protein